MSQYRDDLDAAHARIASLEHELEAQTRSKTRNEALVAELASDLEQARTEIDRLRALSPEAQEDLQEQPTPVRPRSLEVKEAAEDLPQEPSTEHVSTPQLRDRVRGAWALTCLSGALAGFALGYGIARWIGVPRGSSLCVYHAVSMAILGIALAIIVRYVASDLGFGRFVIGTLIAGVVVTICLFPFFAFSDLVEQCRSRRFHIERWQSRQGRVSKLIGLQELKTGDACSASIKLSAEHDGLDCGRCSVTLRCAGRAWTTGPSMVDCSFSESGRPFTMRLELPSVGPQDPRKVSVQIDGEHLVLFSNSEGGYPSWRAEILFP
jgi:hypothetical protein